MKFPEPVSVGVIADIISAELVGNTAGHATGINELHTVEEGDIVFVDHPKYYDTCINSAATFIIINKKVDFPPEKALLIHDQPFEAYLKIVRHFRPFKPSSAVRGESSAIGENTFIYPNVYIGNHVKIGSHCIIHPNVTIMDHCVIGDHVIIQSGTVIGSDAFYYNTRKDREVWYKKMESCGTVVIEDYAEIGAGCTIDRGVSNETRIGKGCKIDNMVHIGHDTVLGNNCLIAAQVGIAGATRVGNGVTMWGQVGVSKTLTIGDNAVLLAQSGVPSSLEGNKTYFGTPSIEASLKRRELVWVKRIPEIWEKIKNL